ncbi:hypothetical protein BDR06DRAFT_664985 [Suillus hirtellus]|nr:hypothetical protein BDR06DRAFT_664985 [Suillus hirtellus]
MSDPYMQHYFNNFRVVPSRSVPEPSHTSAPISSTPVSSPHAAPIFQQTTITPNISLQHLYADVKAILQSVEASLEEQKKTSKDLNDLSTTVNVLKGVLCGNVGPGRGKRKKRKKKEEEEIMDLDTLQSEGGIVRRLATIDGAINHLLARLDTASQEPLPATVPPQGLLKFRPFPFVQHSSETLAPAVYPNNSYRSLGKFSFQIISKDLLFFASPGKYSWTDIESSIFPFFIHVSGPHLIQRTNLPTQQHLLARKNITTVFSAIPAHPRVQSLKLLRTLQYPLVFLTMFHIPQ